MKAVARILGFQAYSVHISLKSPNMKGSAVGRFASMFNRQANLAGQMGALAASATSDAFRAGQVGRWFPTWK